MIRFRLFCALLAACTLPLGGCDLLGGSSDGNDSDEGQWTVQPGAIVFYGDTTSITLSADTVQVGHALRVSATTFGGGCHEAAGMSAVVEDRRATLTPLDSVYTPGPREACTQQLKVLDHSAEVTFEQAGEARVAVTGKGEGPRFENGEGDVRFERTVVVVE